MNKIKALAKKKHLSYKALENETGLSAAYICYLANNKRNNPSLEAMQKIAAALDENVETVFDLNHETGPQKIAQ